MGRRVAGQATQTEASQECMTRTLLERSRGGSQLSEIRDSGIWNDYSNNYCNNKNENNKSTGEICVLRFNRIEYCIAVVYPCAYLTAR